MAISSFVELLAYGRQVLEEHKKCLDNDKVLPNALDHTGLDWRCSRGATQNVKGDSGGPDLSRSTDPRGLMTCDRQKYIFLFFKSCSMSLDGSEVGKLRKGVGV